MFSEPIRLIKTYPETISDGEGLRYSIYFAGCSHHCQGCHNPDSWRASVGTLLTVDRLDEIIKEINNNPLLDGVTFSGGDPFYYPKAFAEVLQKVKQATNNINIWAYTGFTLEQIEQNRELNNCLQYIDVLVDGRFDQKKYSPTLTFVGSSNQRIINVKTNEILIC